MARTEKRVKELIRERIRKRIKERKQAGLEPDVVAISPMTFGSGKSGVSDLVFCVRGRFAAIETKAENPRAKATELQELFLRKVKAAGGHTLVTSDPNEAYNFIDKIATDEEATEMTK